MNRNDEFRDYLDSFGDTPPELEYTLTRARARLKARRRRAIFAPLGTLCAFALCFVGLVNMSESFASACYDIPVLRELAAAVDFSPSLSRAVENDYVQELGLEQTVNGIDCRIEYVIVDGAQLNVFFTLSGGEKFLVSLALSLGLSAVVRAQAGGVAMEAIFIDEGFGSLDPASIRDALDVLTRIGAGGKVGIISHVEALRENILQGIEVVKGKAGSRVRLHV